MRRVLTVLALSASLSALSGTSEVLRAAASPAQAVTGTPAAGELFAAADTSGGYSGLVLQKVLPHWQPPADVSGLARILVRVSSQGRVLSCEPLRPLLTESTAPAHSGTPETIPGTSATVSPLAPPLPSLPAPDRRLADMACMAVAAAGEFEVPPYGLIAEVSLILSAGNVRGQLSAQPADYANLVLQRVQPHIVLPPRMGGEFTVSVTVKVRGDGSLESLGVHKSSGRKDVDAAVLQAFTVPGVVPPPPGGTPRELQLTYTLRNQ